VSDSAPAAASGAGGTAADGASPARRTPDSGDRKRGLFARIALFVRQVVAELKKVVRPTRSELFTYTGVVLVFVLVVMAFVTVLDLGIGQVTLWVFGD
jgi:preprotein translocase subunit SecE